MKIFRTLEEIKDIKNAVVTTGSFDGVHVGHKVIINRLNKLAKDINGESVLITFHPHPRRVLYPQTQGKDLLLI
ncbi:MAG: riboflavin biosynthesis protein RibF, partial [Bacteroidota bacterium]